MKYFKDIKDLGDLRKQYKDLLKKYHPDNPDGSTQATQEINAEYDILFKQLKNNNQERRQKKDENEKTSDYENMKYDFSEDKKLREVLEKIIGFTEINIEIVGAWIWVDGDTFQYRKELHSYGFKWAREKKKWYFHTDTFRKKSHKKLTMEEIRNYYGSTDIKPEERKKLQG